MMLEDGGSIELIRILMHKNKTEEPFKIKANRKTIKWLFRD